MHSTLFALSALASVAVANLGKAIVVNNCGYNVNLCNVPASNGGQSEYTEELAPGKTYTQTWTSLTNGMGWSIKLSKSDGSQNILQYEYTCHEDGVIWYDLSNVNGNPWDGDWDISAPDNSGCNPRQAAYRYSTDDAHGMQDSCPEGTDITLVLCSKSGGSGGGSNSTSPAPAPAAPAPAPVYSSPAPAPKPAPQPAPQPATSAPAPAPTYAAPAPVYPEKQEASTLVTSSAPAKTHVVATTIVEVETVYATAYVTVAPHKRHVHHPHQHGHA